MGQFENRLKSALAGVRRSQLGRIAEIEAGLDYQPGYLAKLSHSGHRLCADDFERAAKALGQDPVRLGRRALARLDIESLLSELPSLTTGRRLRELRSAARAVRVAARRATKPEPAEAAEAEALAAGLREGEAEVRAGWLKTDPRYRSLAVVLAAARELDEHRHTNPLATIKMARALTVEVCPHLQGPGAAEAFCRAASALGTAYRITGAHALATAVLKISLPFATCCENPALLADVYQRIAHLFCDHMRFEVACELGKEAGQIYLGLGDRAGVGKALTDCGIFLYLQGDLKAAEAELRFALAVLPSEECMYRMAASFSLARALRELGEHAAAIELFQEAECLLEPCQPFNRACFLFARGEVHQATGELGPASSCFRSARDLFREADPFAAAFAGLDLVYVLLRQGRFNTAQVETRALATLLQPLAQHPAAVEVLRDLVRIAARVGLEHVSTARRRLEEARPRTGGPLPTG